MDLVKYSAVALAPSEQIKLVESLLLCPSMNSRAKRDTIMRMLPKINRVASRQDDAFTDVINILQTCLSYSGAVHDLFEAIYGFDGATENFPIVARTFGETLGEIFGPSLNGLTNTHLENLKQILDNVEFDWAAVQLAFKRSMNDSPLPSTPNLSRSFTLMIWRAATRTELVPIMEFTRSLGRIQPSIQLAIADWINQLVQDMPQGAAAVSTAQTSSAPIREPCLQIALSCKARQIDESTQVGVKAVLWRNADDPPEPLDSDSITMGDVPAFVQGLVQYCSDQVQPHQIKVEVFLPLLLLKSHAVEQWSFSDGLGDSWWGNDYPIVVRSFDRFQACRSRQELGKLWSEKWHHLARLDRCESVEQPVLSDEHIAWICSCVPQDIRATIVGAAVLVEVDRVPPIFYQQKPQQFINYLLLIGVPMAFWVRNSLVEGDQQSLEHECRQLIQSTSPSQLAARLRERRQGAAADSFWWQITFLWDDPNRIPDDFIRDLPGTQSERRPS
jgi:hypothetical protein